MSEFVRDTEVVIHPACPGCVAVNEPERDPATYDTQWCETHRPPRDGADDALARVADCGPGNSEAGGDDNRRWCSLFHGGRS